MASTWDLLIDLSGQKFGMLTATEYGGVLHGHALWLCVCECGRQSVVASNDLRGRHINSCGCQLGRNPGSHVRGQKRSAETVQRLSAARRRAWDRGRPQVPHCPKCGTFLRAAKDHTCPAYDDSRQGRVGRATKTALVKEYLSPEGLGLDESEIPSRYLVRWRVARFLRDLFEEAYPSPILNKVIFEEAKNVGIEYKHLALARCRFRFESVQIPNRGTRGLGRGAGSQWKLWFLIKDEATEKEYKKWQSIYESSRRLRDRMRGTAESNPSTKSKLMSG